MPLLATRALLVYLPARGEQGDGPMDNEGFYVDNEGNMVHECLISLYFAMPALSMKIGYKKTEKNKREVL